MRRNLHDMVTVITGASAGIGRALAVELAQQGGRLVLGARRLDRLHELAKELRAETVCVETDVACPHACHRLIGAALDKFHRVDTLVCNAGYGFARPIEQMSEADIRQIFDTNLFGTIECCRAAIVAMKDQSVRDGFRGQLMIVSSACARRGLPYFSTYAATKAAQLSLAEGLRIELKPLEIAVTSVHPVVCGTDFFSTAHELSGMSPAALIQGRPQTPQYVAGKMVRGIEKPVRELWPKPFSRLSLLIANALPGVVDRVMSQIRDRMLRENQSGSKSLRSQRAHTMAGIDAEEAPTVS
jgi:short-subunit dehydrogenase